MVCYIVSIYLKKIEMNSAVQTDKINPVNALQGTSSASIGSTPEVLTRIYDEQVNLTVLQRVLTLGVEHYCQQLMSAKPQFNLRSVVQQEKAFRSLSSLLPVLEGHVEFVNDLSELLEMYAYLFELEEVGLRLQVLDRAMCPRFHTDKLGCRLVTTYQGEGTEWLHNHVVDRTKLGAGSRGLSDLKSGLFPDSACIQQVSEGDIVLLKGDGWFGNEGMGAVHRSPAVPEGAKRVVVTMDFA